MLKKMFFLIILIFANFSFASVEILENSDGRIVAKVNFGNFVYEKGANPMIFLSFTADKNSKPQISATPQNKFTKKIPDKLEKQSFSPVLNFSMARNIPLFSAGVSPILETSGNEIKYTTEMIVVINYYAGTARNSVPRNDYYNAISAKILNPDRIKNTITVENQKTLRNLREFNTINKTALRFWIGDEPSSTNENEADLHAKAGIYKITPADLLDLGSNLDINTIKIRSSNPNVADSITPSFATIPEGLVDVPLIIRDKNNNGKFDGDDEILFYAEKIHIWYFNDKTNVKSWDFLFNYTDFRRYYWITANETLNEMKSFKKGDETTLQTTGDVYYRGKRSSSITTGYEANIGQGTFGANVFGHGDKRWVWTTLWSNNSSISTSDFPNNFTVNSLAGDTEIKFFAHEKTQFTGLDFYVPATAGSFAVSIGDWFKFNNQKAANFKISAKTFDEYNSRNQFVRGYLDFDGYALRYSQNLSLKNENKLQFYSKGGVEAPASYRISDLPTEYRLLVRHNPKTQVTEFIDSSSASGNFEFSDPSGNGFKYHLATQKGFLRIPKPEIVYPSSSNSPYHITDLLSNANRTDYLIIAPPAFLGKAIELATHKREEIKQFNFPRVVTTEDIFKTFSGGVFSPEAIRNFMVYAKNSWQEWDNNSYLVLFGSGHYEYKKVSLAQTNHIPVYISKAFQYHPELISYPVEDFFAYTNPGTVAGNWNAKPENAAFPQMIVGRIPAKNTNEAGMYLQKIQSLENFNADFSSWRNRPLLIADDDIQNDVSRPESLPHTQQSDEIGRRIIENDKSADIRKITLLEFPFDAQLNKPLARRALISEINSGVSIINYFGHGSRTVLADQEIFTISDIASLTNLDRYFIFGAFSCSVGFFDDPAVEGISEKLVRETARGAINSISSTRTAFSTENAEFANSFYESFYSKDSINSVGQAYLGAKLTTNPPTFALLGDPSYIPMINRKKITDIKILNEKKEPVDTLKKMQNVIISGNLQIANDGVLRVAEVTLQNPENLNPTRKDGLTHPVHPVINGAPYQYTLPGMITTRQTFEFSGNTFEIPLMIPPTVLDTTLGSQLKIHVRNKNGGNEIFIGVKDSEITFLGFDTTNVDINDKEGPVISVHQFFADSTGRIDTTKNTVVGNKITIDGFNKRSGIATLDIRIADKSGVDIFSSDMPGGGVSVSIDRVMNRRQYNKDELTLINEDFRNVSLPLQLSQSDFPAVGEYELTITARDILQNITTQRFILDIKSLRDEQYAIGDFFCYPSPVRMGQTTQFFFNKTGDNVSEISLKIYTLNGKLVRSFPNAQRGVVWDLTDQRGQKLSPNVYLYRLFVKRYKRDDNNYQNTNKTEIIKSKVKKLVIYPPK